MEIEHMKFIDEQGKIFGKLNIIDVAILIFIVIALFAGYKYLYLQNYPENILDRLVAKEIIWVNVTVQQDSGDTDMQFPVRVASIGDIAHRQNAIEQDITTAKILKINKSYRIIGAESEVTTQYIIIYEVLVEKSYDGLYYEGTKIRIGSSFIFNTDTYILTGLIMDIEIPTAASLSKGE